MYCYVYTEIVMNKGFALYVSEKLVDDIRKGVIPSPETCESFSHYPIIDVVRSLIKESDIIQIKKLISQEHEDQRALGCALLGPFIIHPEVREFLEDQWRNGTLTFRDRVSLQFTLLNYEDLDSPIRDEMRDFTFNNWGEWINQASVRWAGGPDKVLGFCSQRLSNPKTAKTKYWVYLCGVAASNDRDAAMKFISSYRGEADPFLCDVIDRVLARL